MKRSTLETTVGLFVFIGLACVGYLTIELGKVQFFSGDTYSVHGKFASVAGLRRGASVEIAGVSVGQVDAIRLDKERMVADVWMKIRKDVPLSDDVIASVKTAGLIGDKYIKISPGASEDMLKNDGLITDTESAVDIEELVSKYVFGDVK